MKWNELTVFTTEEGVDSVAARFGLFGIDELVIEQGREEIAAFLRDTAKYWDFADMDELSAKEPCVKAYIADAEENEALIEDITASFKALKAENVGVDLGSLRVVRLLRDDEDWANSWKLNYKPMEIGERLLIRPSWIDDYDAKSRAVLSIDPGMAFGTGSHQTTRMCLEAIEKHIKTGVNALDLGCGSGILAIASLLLGAKHEKAIDIDQIAEGIVRENARLNGIADEACEIMIGDVLMDEAVRARVKEEKYGLITANIVASVIIALTPLVREVIEQDGIFITSGIISERLDEVLKALDENGFAIVEVNAEDDWREITARLK